MASKRKDSFARGVLAPNVFLGGVALTALPLSPAFAEPRAIDIPSEEAAKSIPEFARQENIQIVAPVSQLHGIKTPAVRGRMELDVALGALLVGTGLEIASNDGTTVVLRQGSAAPSVTSAAAAPLSESAEVPPPSESIVVTGSRVILDAANSPTPLTIVSSKQLHDTTPSNLADGLNKLPIFQGSQILGRPGDGSQNFSSNVLNLRNFGVQRTLILLDGHRAPPSNSDGTVDIDTLPQMLVNRVDIVTGGASAVYGSDAVTGVVNFILDKKFKGFRADINAGISTYADAMSYNLGAAAGTDLFGGRGHFEAALEYRHRDPVNQSARPYGPPANYAALVGTGTAANPFNSIPNGRRPNSSFGGVVQGCVPACPLAAGTQFASDGVLTPFYAGIAGATDGKGNPTQGTSNLNSGGDGAYSPYGQVFDGYHQGTLFGRFSYDLADNVTFYVQGQGSEAYSFGWYFAQKIQPGAGQADLFYKNNPFLPAAVQAQLGNDGTNPAQSVVNGVPLQPSNTFQLGEFLTGLGQTETNATGSVNRVLSVQAGLDGTVMDGRFAWNLFYAHSQNRLAVDLINNQNLQHMYAAEDAVSLPNGTVACYATAQNVPGYGNCVPINPFGPTAVTWNAFRYMFQTTDFHQTNTLDDFGASIAGKLLEDWAGPITAALSAEMRFNAYDVTSNVPSSTFVDCTGLRLCNPLLPSFSQTVLQPVHASNNVWEIAAEAVVPLLKNTPLARNLDVNLAGRYTDYSISGSVQTWKIGFNWNVVDALRFRGTTSIDIRAPTLDDLFRPATLLQNVFTDLHVDLPAPNPPGSHYSATTTFSSQGNPALVPEVARTYTVGAVWTPESIPGLTMSLDYFRIHLANAIGSIAPSTTIQALCEQSGGSSIYCANYQRPLPFSDRTVANFATRLYTFNLNTASTQTEGWDFETNYAWAMSDLIDGWKGSWNARGLATYQPVINKSVLFPGAPWVRVPDPSTRITGFLNYSLNDWSIGLQDSWVSGFSQVAGPVTATINNWVNPHVGAWNQLDANITRNFEMGGANMAAYFVVQNLFNAQPAYVPNGTIGQWYPVYTSGYSVQSPMGRYLTLGLRANL
ncbi:MAG TPA: TonB-dependent receptor [Rhizomicrobium sp.]|nr:TonB-dependent receptor [Rhizomicrobium sp.]